MQDGPRPLGGWDHVFIMNISLQSANETISADSFNIVESIHLISTVKSAGLSAISVGHEESS